jgi:copper chaperone NosL
MRPLALALLLGAGCGSPETGPVPIAYGEDACDVCRMIISERNFAAQARFGPDRVEKFDDIGCLAERLWRSPKPVGMWVADHGTGEMHPLESLCLVRAPELKTPMGSGVAAFLDPAEGDAFLTKHRGAHVTLEDIKATRKPGKSLQETP